MQDTDDIGSNPTDNPHLADLIEARVSRRAVLGGGLAAAALGFFGGSGLLSPTAALADDDDGDRDDDDQSGGKGRGTPLGFAEVPPSADDLIHVPSGYTAQVLVPWGAPLFRNSPEWAADASNTAADQELQVGFNHDGMSFFPLGDDGGQSGKGLLVLNHEYTDASQIYTAAQGSTITPDAAGKEKVAKALAAHGVTVVEVRHRRGAWEHVRGSRYNRRITGTTPMAFSGPVPASHPMLRSELGNPPRGTLNNCANGQTPWGTYLACEENWNGYFGTDDPAWAPTALEARYGVSKGGFGYQWHRAEARFDVAKNRNELNHFGWVVEIDPFDPRSTPVKRIALGRIKHEGATVVEQRDGRVAVYTGDDENGDYLYKFVSALPWREARRRRRSPLDEGTLYVAQFHADGSGTWLPLVHGTGPLTPANGWVDQADVLIRTRQAGDAVGATRLHRPEWVAANERTGDVFVTLTNGTGNKSPVNSDREPNPYGHIVRFREVGGHGSPTAFAWDVFLYAGDPAYPALEGGKVPAGQPVFGSPDGIFVDVDGLVWIQTDISNSSQNLASRGYDRIGNNQMLVADPKTKQVKRFLTGPRGCEITGIVVTPDQRTMFVNVQHPGESTTFWNDQYGAPTTADPDTVSSWPDPAAGRPRSATVVIRRVDGGKVGT